MSHRSPTAVSNAGETSNLASVLHDCLQPAILLFDLSGKILAASPESVQLLNLPPRPADSPGLPLLPEALQKIVRHVAATGQPAAKVLSPAATGTASVWRVKVHSCPAPDGGVQVLLTIHDDAIWRRIEDNLDRLDRLAGIGALAAGMAHEIKNAFVAIKTFVELLLESKPDAELGDIVQRELQRIESILGQMLRFRAPTRPALAPLHIHEVLEHSLRLLQHHFESRLITVKRHFSADHDSVKGNDYQLEQSFLNLLLNALDAMGPNGTLTISTELVSTPHAKSPGRELSISIADDGVGITPANMERLFEPFFTTKQNGTGLGLAITRRIIREHHGEITAHSEVNRGTRFHIVLPAFGA